VTLLSKFQFEHHRPVSCYAIPFSLILEQLVPWNLRNGEVKRVPIDPENDDEVKLKRKFLEFLDATPGYMNKSVMLELHWHPGLQIRTDLREKRKKDEQLHKR